jgi:hypothetical protein
MSTIDIARAASAGATRVRPTSSRGWEIRRVWAVCATWTAIVGSAMALSRALEAAPLRERARLAARWLELLEERRI